MIKQIEVEGRNIPFPLDWENRHWHSLEEPNETDFPLIVEVDGKSCAFFLKKRSLRSRQIKASDANQVRN